MCQSGCQSSDSLTGPEDPLPKWHTHRLAGGCRPLARSVISLPCEPLSKAAWTSSWHRSWFSQCKSPKRERQRKQYFLPPRLVSYSSGRYNSIAWSGCLINYRNLFLTILEAGSPKSWWQHGLWLVKALFQVADGHLLVSSHHGQRARELSRVCLSQGHWFHSWRPHLHNRTPPKCPTSSILTGGWDFNICILGVR